MQEGLQLAGAVRGGQATKAQSKSEALLAERQAQDVDLQALQASEQRRADLRSAMSTIEARRAAAGVGLDSPSAIAIQKGMRRQSQRAEAIDQVGYGNQTTALRTSAVLKRQYGKLALQTAWLSGTGNALASLGQKVASAGAGGA